MKQTRNRQTRLTDGLGRRLIECGVFWMAVFALAAGAVFYVPAALTASSKAGNRELPIYCVQTSEKKVSLTFDAAWGNEDTDQILAILEKYHVRATFFMTGEWVTNYPEDVQRIADAGHDLANHSNTHPQMSSLNAEQMKKEIRDMHEKVKELTGIEMNLFRPPYGDYNDLVVTTAMECGYYPIQWDVDSLDWKDYGVDSIIKTVCEHKHLGNGSIVLLHNGSTYTAQALEAVIQGLQAKGYELVPVSELIYTKDYHMDAEGRQIPDQAEKTTVSQ
jgi:polysaccharide deacetylase family sporulation protein PdaB